MMKLKFHKLVPMLVAIAFASTALLVAAEPADAASALFRAKRTWWFSQTPTWTDGLSWPTADTKAYEYPAALIVGDDTPNPSFNMPKSHIKNTTYTWYCPQPPFQCYPGYPIVLYSYSYWNGAARFQKNHSQAAPTTTTVRRRTVMDGWPGPITATTPTAMFTLATPTEGGCVVNGGSITHPRDCPGTTQFGGRYTQSRGGSIMIFPGTNKFGGTLRWFGGPNAKSYQYISYFKPLYFKAYSQSPPLSLQPTSNDPIEIGEVAASGYLKRYRLTNPTHALFEVIGDTTPNSAACAPGYPTFGTARPPTNPGCEYYLKFANYVRTAGPYTTGMVTNWDYNGISSFWTETGYDNRTPAGLSGTISLVQPRLFHVYTVSPESTGLPIELTWSSSRLRRMDFKFLPEPTGVAMLAAGFVTLASLYRLRRR